MKQSCFTTICKNQADEIERGKRSVLRQRHGLLMAMLLLVSTQLGCINTMVMVGKVLLGDPLQKSGFEVANGISLKKTGKSVLVHCSAPATVSEDYGALTSDIEVELLRRMRRHDLNAVHSDRASKTFDRLGGTFNPQAISEDLKDLDYVFHIRVERFSYLEDSSPNFYRGNAVGQIVGYELRGNADDRHAVQVYEQRFTARYPTTYPVSVETTSKNVFIRRFIDNIADSLGTSFYDVHRTELYAN